MFGNVDSHNRGESRSSAKNEQVFTPSLEQFKTVTQLKKLLQSHHTDDGFEQFVDGHCTYLRQKHVDYNEYYLYHVLSASLLLNNSRSQVPTKFDLDVDDSVQKFIEDQFPKSEDE